MKSVFSLTRTPKWSKDLNGSHGSKILELYSRDNANQESFALEIRTHWRWRSRYRCENVFQYRKLVEELALSETRCKDILQTTPLSVRTSYQNRVSIRHSKIPRSAQRKESCGSALAYWLWDSRRGLLAEYVRRKLGAEKHNQRCQQCRRGWHQHCLQPYTGTADPPGLIGTSPHLKLMIVSMWSLIDFMEID